MAEELRHEDVGIGFNFDFEKLNKVDNEVTRLIDRIEKIGGSFNGINENVHRFSNDFSGAFTKAQVSVEGFTKANGEAKRNIQEMNRSATTMRDKLANLNNVYDSYSDSQARNSRSATKAWQEQLGAIDRVKNGLRNLPKESVTKVKFDTGSVSTGTQHVQRELAKTDRAADKTKSKFMGVKDVIAGSFVGSAISNGISALVSGLHSAAEVGMKYNKEQDTMKTVWTSLTTEAPKDGKNLVNFINEMSQKTIYGADTLNEMAQSFYHVHSSEKETKNWTNDFIALGSTLHMSNSALAESGEQFAKIVAGGKASSEDMAVMINRFPMFGEALQQATGKSMKQLYAMSAAGKLSAKQFTETLSFLGKKYKSGTAEAMTSAMGMSMYIKSRYQKLSGDVMRTSFKMSKDTSSAMTNLLSDKMMTKYAHGISSALGTVTSGAVKAIGYLDKHKTTIIDILSNGGKILGIVGSAVWDTFGDTLHLIGTTFGLINKNGKKSEDPLETVDDLLKGIAGHEQGIRNTAKAITGIIITSKVIGMVKSLSGLVTMLGHVRKSTLEVADAEAVASAAGDGEASGSLLSLFGAKGKHSGTGAHAAGTAVADMTRTERGAQFATGATRLERAAASGGKLSKIFSKIPALGKGTVALTALTALPDLFSMTKKTAGKSIGSYVGDVGGGLGGAAAGAAIGSIIPGAGTAVGGLIGGGLSIGGSILGSKIGSKALGSAGNWIQKTGSHASNETKKALSGETPKKSKKSSSKPKKSQWQKEFDSLPTDARTATKKATGLIKNANEDWTKSEGLWHAGSAKSRAESNRMQAKSDASYAKAYSVLSDYSNKSNKSTSKSASYLAKLGLINQNQASKAVSIGKDTSNKQLSTIRNTMKNLKTAEHNGGTDRFRLQQKLNGEILRLTDKGSKKQTALLKKLNGETGRLSSKQYTDITKQAKSAEKSTIKSADNQYKSSKKSANKRYELTKKSAADIYDKHSAMYKKIVKKAGDQRDETIQSAKKQHDKTVDWATKQRKAVVKEAEKQAGDLVDTFTDAAGKAVSVFKNPKSVEYLLNQNATATGGKYTSRPKTDDQAIAGYFGTPTLKSTKVKPGAKSVNVGNGIGKSSSKLNNTIGEGYFTGHAHGGAISKRQTAMVGENGFEVLQRHGKFSIIGQHGAQLIDTIPGDQIYNHADAKAMMSGSYGKRIPGFAAGTTKTRTRAVSGAGSIVTAINRIAVLVRSIGRVNSKAGAKTAQTDDKGAKTSLSTKGAKKQLATFSSDSKKLWGTTTKDTKKSTQKISKNSADDYGDSTKNMRSSLKQFNKQNDAIWDDTAKDTKSRTNSIYKQATNKVGDTSSDTVSEVKSMRKQFISVADDAATGFGKAFAKLGPYAHKGMGSAVTALNKGISGIDTTLSQFGGNKAVLDPIHYASGSNGPIANDQLAVLNDATAGPRQELVVRDNKLLKPHGNDVLTHLRKNDEVLNGSQVEKIKPFLPHFAKGTGVSNDRLISLASKNAKNPKVAWTNEFAKNVGKSGSTDLSQGILKTAGGAANSVGPAWSSAMWGLIDSTIQSGGSGNGSLSPHFGGAFKESSGYGRRSGEVSGFHKGIDFAAPLGTPIPAQYAGKVVQAGSAAGFGNWVVIQPNGMNVDTIYGHMRSYNVHAGETVKAGQTIARVGSEGQSTGPHVHYEIRQGLGGKSFDPDTYKGKVAKKSSDKGLNALVKRQLGSKAIKWIEDNLGMPDIGNLGTMDTKNLTKLFRAAAAKMHAKIPGGPYMSYLLKMVANESGGNAKIKGIDDHDGTGAAMGLMQYKHSTFDTYALPGHKNILSAWDQALAFFNNSHYATDIGIGYNGKVGEWRGQASGPSGGRRFAKGGRPPVGEWSIVGEEGPELFKADKPGTIIPHKQSKSLVNRTVNHSVSGGNKVEINQKITIKADGASGDLKQQVSAAMAQPNSSLVDQLSNFFEPNNDGGLVI